MKKIFFSLVAIAAIAACSKSEVEYTDQVEIGFAPVAHNVTKSVAGLPTTDGHDETFPTTQDLFIYANAQEQNAAGALVDGSFPDVYFKKAQFEWRGDSNIYDGTPAQYWPNVKSLIFAGYSEACNSAALTPTMDFVANELTIAGYVQDNTMTEPGKNDLMWFPWDGASYSRRSTAVNVTLKHACSWITVKVIGDATTGVNYKLHDLTINNLYHKGTAVCDDTKALWDDYVTESKWNEIIYSNTPGATFPKSGDAVVFENVPNNFVVIPQTPTTIDVTYSYYAQAGADLITETVKNLPLAVGEGDANVWESGKHYIYTITITATEILVAPKVEGWADQTVVNIPVPNN
ncbi:MAG: fimbrillin family protein [Bacteroidales bacterium]|nr:fimbrillin family protein [Bacteroidales bacterium]